MHVAPPLKSVISTTSLLTLPLDWKKRYCVFCKKIYQNFKSKTFYHIFQKKKFINKKCFFILTKIFNETNTIKYLKYISENTNYSKRNETNEIGCVRGRLKIQPKK